MVFTVSGQYFPIIGWLFIVPGPFFKISGFVLWFFMVPAWFLSELSAKGH